MGGIWNNAYLIFRVEKVTFTNFNPFCSHLILESTVLLTCIISFNIEKPCKFPTSVSILSLYGLDDRAIEVRSSAEMEGFFPLTSGHHKTTWRHYPEGHNPDWVTDFLYTAV
jgi:hypothetical protein